VDVASKVKKIVHRMSQILFAAEIAFRRLDGCMPQQELNLLKLTPAAVAQFGTSSPQVMRCDMLQSRSLAAGLDDVPDNILRDAFPPHLSCSGDGSKDPSLRHPGCDRPLIESRFASRTWEELASGTNIGWECWSRDSKFVYAQDGDSLVRIAIADHKKEQIASLQGFRSTAYFLDRWSVGWFGLTPDGRPISTRDTGIQEIYAFDLEYK
jgi:hypothetical protein